MKKSVLILTMLGLLVTQTDATSLWSNDSPANKFFSSGNASRVGDILSILIEETSTATELADVESKRKTTLLGRIAGLFNNDFDTSVLGQAGAGGAIDYPLFSLQGQNDFKGENDVERSGTFQAQVAATIVMIDDNGNFLIEARKTINVGNETKSIILSGKIRPRDISAANTVESTRIADAQISYEGSGPITSGAEPGLFSRMLRFLF